jgi:hypothetical protein
LALLAPAGAMTVERVTTATPYPRGLVMKDDTLYVLCRGRVRGAGGVTAAVDDQAGTIYAVDPNVTEPVGGPVGDAVRGNGEVFALPTSPPFNLWDRSSDPPQRDRYTDRPYCTLRYHEPTQSFYLCAFSGIDMKRTAEDAVGFSKNLTDALLRYDLRTRQWHTVERHNIAAGGNYPHHDPAVQSPPHGWLNGPDNCLGLGDWLYAVSKDNSLLVRYDLRALRDDPNAGPPPSEVVLNERMFVEGHGVMALHGHSMLAEHDGWLYLGARTSSMIVRMKLRDDMTPAQPIVTQLVARFDPYDAKTGKSANLTDMAFDDRGRLYVVSAKPSRVFRFAPDPADVFDGRTGAAEPWADLAALTDNPRMKSENVMVHAGWLYVTSGDGYDYQQGADGTVYRVKVDD